ncbi:unnamed protein product, partial [Tetraodon nigroviridis]
MQNKVKKGTPPVRDKEGEKEEEVPVEPQKSEKGDGVSKDPVNSTFVDPEKETVKELVPRNVKPATGKIVNVRMKNKPQGKNEEKKARSQSAFESEGDDVESELESSEEEDKQYFDDSTEERFHKQSSQSEDSDSEQRLLCWQKKGSQGRRWVFPSGPQQALHPSWEASRKRKEQQGQIMAFQGKKIKFDDD